MVNDCLWRITALNIVVNVIGATCTCCISLLPENRAVTAFVELCMYMTLGQDQEMTLTWQGRTQRCCCRGGGGTESRSLEPSGESREAGGGEYERGVEPPSH